MQTTQIDNPDNMMTWTLCFALPGATSIIDMAHPITKLSSVYKRTLAEIQERYPSAELVRYDEVMARKIAEQDAEPRTWSEVTKERYWEMLEVLPPAAMQRGAFLIGEASNHCAKTGRARFACYKEETGKFFELASPITFKEFCEMFGKTSYCYQE